MPFEELDQESLCPMDREGVEFIRAFNRIIHSNIDLEGVEFIRAFNRIIHSNVVAMKIHKDDWKALVPAMGLYWDRFQQEAHERFTSNRAVLRERR